MIGNDRKRPKISLQYIWLTVLAGLMSGLYRRVACEAGTLQRHVRQPKSMIVSSACALGKNRYKPLVRSPREGGGSEAIPGTDPAWSWPWPGDTSLLAGPADFVEPEALGGAAVPAALHRAEGKHSPACPACGQTTPCQVSEMPHVHTVWPQLCTNTCLCCQAC